MPSVSFTGIIARPVEEVFAFVTDPAMHSRWQKNVVEAGVVSETPCVVGSVGREVRRFFGKHIETTYRVTVFEPGRRFVTESFESALEGQKRQTPPTPTILDGAGEAKVIALRLGKPPAGYGRWTLRLLAEQVVELEIVEAISHETIRTTLKKMG